MKSNPYKIISVLISAFILICIMPFYYVNADDVSTYYELSSQTCTLMYTTPSVTYSVQTNNDSRLVIIETTSRFQLYAVSLINNTKYGTTDSCPVNSVTNGGGDAFNTATYNNVTYYWVQLSKNSTNHFNIDFPVYTDKSLGNLSMNNELAYRLTYGDMSIDPTPPIQAGVLTFNYYTDFASNQQNTIGALQSNRDTITWDYDTTNSNIPGLDLKVDIRAVPSKYYASTEDALESLTWSDLSIDINYSADLGSYQMNWNNRKVSYTWGEVVDKVKLVSNLPDYYNDLVNSWNFKFIKLNDLWYWTGWVYQIRLNTFSGDYTGEWQTIYQVSSAPPEGSSETINYYVMNGTGVTEPIYQTIQNINNQNNVTNNTWYVNGSPYSIDNDSGQNWWETLLQFISDLVGSILSFLGSIFDSVITGVLELVNNLGINFLEVFSNLINRIVELFGNIDLTGQNYLIPEEYTENLNTFNIWTTGLFNVFINSGLGLLVFIPFILLIVRLFI